MKIILTADIKKVGKKGEVITVKDGYGTFLLKNNQAVLATTHSLDRLTRENQQSEEAEQELIKKLTAEKDKLQKEVIEFKVKTGNQDKVFGSISSKQVCDQLIKLGYHIDKKQIELDTPLSTLGTHKVRINLHKKVTAIIDINLVK